MKKIIFLVLLLIANVVYSEEVIIFQDNFDDHTNWAPTQPVYPNTIANQSQDGTSSVQCTGCPDGEAKYMGYFVASSAWSGYAGEDTLQINSDNPRGGTGKSLTVWMEPIDSTLCDGGSGWCSDGQLAVSLDDNYNEVYLQYYIKFQPGWEWDSTNANSSEKFMHITHWTGNSSVWTFFNSGNHWPILVGYFKYPEHGGGGTGIASSFGPRYQVSYYPNSANPSLTTTGQNMDDAFVLGGTGTGGRKTFEELLGDGNWHKLKWHVKGNTQGGYYPGSPNGVYEMWIDDDLVFSRSDVAWADNSGGSDDNLPARPFDGWNWVSIGGNGYNRYYSSSTQVEQWYAIDDVVVTTDSGSAESLTTISETGSLTFSTTGTTTIE